MFDGNNYINNASDFCLKLKGEVPKSINKKIVEYDLQLRAQKGSGFDTWIILNNLLINKHINDIIKIGKDIISLRVFNCYIENGKKQNPHFLKFRCGMIHLHYSLKKIRKNFQITKRIIENWDES